MRALGLSRLLAVAIIATLALSVLGAASPASAAPARGSVMIHSRVCPLNLPAGSMLFDDCHSHPGPSGAEFTVDNRVPKAIGANGNVSFGRLGHRAQVRPASGLTVHLALCLGKKQSNLERARVGLGHPAILVRAEACRRIG
jgi:hypothetical protein